MQEVTTSYETNKHQLCTRFTKISVIVSIVCIVLSSIALCFHYTIEGKRKQLKAKYALSTQQYK